MSDHHSPSLTRRSSPGVIHCNPHEETQPLGSRRKFAVSPPAQREYRVLGGVAPSGAEKVARDALARARDERALATINPLSQALVLATEAGDITAMKDVHAMATALQTGARARGLGIEAENQAAEVILRSEREMGKALITLKDAGLFGTHTGAIRHDGLVAALVAALRGDEHGKTPAELAALTGFTPKNVSMSLTSNDYFRMAGYADSRKGSGRRPGLWVLDPAHPYTGDRAVTREDLRLTEAEAINFQRVAALSDDMFERLLFTMRATGKRIAKINFYRAEKQPGDLQPVERQPDPISPDFDMFRDGCHGLLGWAVDEDGVGGPTANGLLTVSVDELAELKELVQHLAAAYGEARRTRGLTGAA